MADRLFNSKPIISFITYSANGNVNRNFNSQSAITISPSSTGNSVRDFNSQSDIVNSIAPIEINVADAFNSQCNITTDTESDGDSVFGFNSQSDIATATTNINSLVTREFNSQPDINSSVLSINTLVTRELNSVCDISITNTSNSKVTREFNSTVDKIFSSVSDIEATRAFNSQLDISSITNSITAKVENRFVSQSDISNSSNNITIQAENRFVSQSDLESLTESDGNVTREFNSTVDKIFSTISNIDYFNAFNSQSDIATDTANINPLVTREFNSQSDVNIEISDFTLGINNLKTFSSNSNIRFIIPKSSIRQSNLFDCKPNINLCTISDISNLLITDLLNPIFEKEDYVREFELII